MGALDGELRLFARIAGAHERAHVRALTRTLGRNAVAKPRFDFRATTEDADAFAATARVLEDTGVADYAGQAPLIDSDALRAQVLRRVRGTRFIVARRRTRTRRAPRFTG